MTRLRCPIVLLVCLIASAAPPSRALVNGKPPAEDDRRFDAIAAFSRTDWLNPSDTRPPDKAHNWFGCTTLIAPDAVLLAKHLLPKGDTPPRQGAYTVRFRRRPDGGLGSRKDGPQSYHQVKIARFITSPASDLAIGVLFDPVTHIQPIRMDLSDTPLDGTSGGGLLAGWGSESPALGAAGPRRELLIGPNRLQRTSRGGVTSGGGGGTSEHSEHSGGGVIRFMDLQTQLREVGKDKDTGQPIIRPHVTSTAAIPNKHDSGGAILLEDEHGQLKLIGVITTITTGVSLAQHAHDDAFPLNLIDPQHPDSVPKRPYAAPLAR